jgi:uncharacterized protein (DUF111 family)
MVVIEANIDDMNPEIHPYVIGRLLDAGAADAWLTPVIMKKGRPGIVLNVLSQAGRTDALTAIIFAETSTIGIRSYGVSRRTLARAKRIVRTSLGDVTVKVIISNGFERLVPEFEECRRLAEEGKIPLVQIYRILERELHGRDVR